MLQSATGAVRRPPLAPRLLAAALLLAVCPAPSHALSRVVTSGAALRVALRDATVSEILVEDNLLLPNDWDTGGEEVSRPLVIAGDPGKCGRRCTLDAGANGVKRRALYIRVGAEAEAGPRPRASSTVRS